jgi:hypothetical protein
MARARPAPDGYSVDEAGVHFIGLINVMNFKPGGLGNLGADCLARGRREGAQRVLSRKLFDERQRNRIIEPDLERGLDPVLLLVEGGKPAAASM